MLLRKLKVPRILAVGIVVATAFGIIFALGWMMSREATDLAADLPNYRATLSEKIQSFRESTSESKVLQKAGDVLTDLQQELNAPTEARRPSRRSEPTAEKPDNKPIPVEITEPEPTGWALYQTIFSTLLPPLATAGIVLLFVIFILLQREDLRDRLIRLFGGSDLQRATSTMTDAATRLSRYFLSQVLINFAYGTLIAGALWLIGVPSPIAWGILAGLMRFVPYVGAYIAAALPLLIAAAIDPGWTTFLLVLALFVVGEMTMGQVVEPQVFGHGTGVTPIALITATIFWTWLWGPLGLLLATPMTVVLAVLGRHVEGLQFFDVLLGDTPALTPQQRFYQRALTGDAAEATYHAELSLKDQSLASYLDTVALSGLKLAERDASRGALDEAQSERVAETVKEMLENLDDFAPHRWFAKLQAQARGGQERQDRQGRGGRDAALPRSMRRRRRGEPCPRSSGGACAGLGGGRADPVDRRAHAARRGLGRDPGRGAEEARARHQGAVAGGDLRRPYRLARQDRGEAGLPVLSRVRRRPGADPLCGAALAAHPARRHADPGLLLERRGQQGRRPRPCSRLPRPMPMPPRSPRRSSSAIKAAKGELKSAAGAEETPPPAEGGKAKRGEPKRKPQSAVA